jgi:hypothetical protein
MRKLFPCLLCVCLAAALPPTSPAQEQRTAGGARVIVGPNLLVSRHDLDMPHAETHIAVNPRNRQNLLGASIVFTNDQGTTCKTYASRDGGYTWMDTNFPERFQFSSGDPQVGFGLHGTAYFLMLSAGETYPMHFYRSEDGGFTWERPRAPRGGDHPQMAVDHTFGRYAGRVYISAMYGVRRLAVSRSEDDGRSLIGPVEVPNPRNFWILNVNPLVLSDGTLFIPYLAWDDAGGRVPTTTLSEFVISSDGGVTFSAPTRVLEQPSKAYVPPTQLRGSFISGTNVVYAVDRSSDRLYVATSYERAGARRRLVLAYSSDRGRTWSAPREVSPDVPPGSAQYQPMIAVNSEGAVGVAWFDTRDFPNEDGYHLYFTASVDGGDSFLAARRISSEPSRPASARNLTPFQGFSRVAKELFEQRFRTAFGRWGNGGDYMGFTADADGAFRPLWVDGRGAAFQVWTTQIRVTRGGGKALETSVPDNLRQTSLVGKIKLLIDPPIYDVERQAATIPIRLQNISTETLYGPFSVEVRKLDQWTILNAANGQRGAGAVFDYSSALGDWRALAPGASTEAVAWRFNYSGLGAHPMIEVQITGQVRGEK